MNEKDLTTSPILKTLFEMAFPMSWGILSVIGFNIVDTYFIGQLGKVQLAAIGLTFPVIMFFFSLALGIGVAISSVVSRYIGEKNESKIKEITTDALIFSFILVAICSVFGFKYIDPLFTLLGATKETLLYVREYMQIWYAGMVFLTVPMAGNGAIRAKGQMKVASAIMITSAIFNIILDPILIFGIGPIPALGVQGAALASVCARAMTFLASFYFLHFKFGMLQIKAFSFSRFISSMKEILKIAIPTWGSNFLTPISMALVTALIARIGENSMAAFAIVNRVESFALIFILAISSSIGPMVGQNFGAQKIGRIKRAISSSFLLAFVWGTIVSFLFLLRPDFIVGIFNDDPKVINQGVWYFKIVPITFGFFGMRLIVSSALNAMGKAYISTLLTGVNLILLYIPFVFLGIYFADLKGVFYAQAVSNLVIGVISYFLIKKILLTGGHQVDQN